MSSNVRELVEIMVEYGVEHLGRDMTAKTMDRVRSLVVGGDTTRRTC
jgi:hypothetical protein